MVTLTRPPPGRSIRVGCAAIQTQGYNFLEALFSIEEFAWSFTAFYLPHFGTGQTDSLLRTTSASL
jgi:hypothetical protein